MHEFRREGPRIDVEAMCWELVDHHEVTALAVDLSSMGLKIERPYAGGPTRREVPLQIEVPGIDEIMWARGDAVFDVVVPDRSPCVRGGLARTSPMGLVRRTGYHLTVATSRELRMLKEFVVETHRARSGTIDDDMLELAPYTARARARP